MTPFLIQSQKLSASIDLLGAQLLSFKERDTGKEYLWQADPAYWPKCAPIMFPIIGRLRQGRYRYQGKTYRITKHGFARDFPFVVHAHTDSRIVFRFASNEQTQAMYPFDFFLDVIFEIDETSLKVIYQVTNTGDHTMIFSIGSHPALDLPLAKTPAQLADYHLKFNQEEYLERFPLENGLMSPHGELMLDHSQLLPLSARLFDRDALIFKQIKSNRITLVHKTEGEIIHMDTGNAPHLGIWSKPEAPFVCLEPWFSYDDEVEDPMHPAAITELEEKVGMMPLEPNALFETYYSLILP